MRWNLRLAAANRGIWQASRAAAPAGRARPGDLGGEDVAACGRATPISLKLDDLDVICAVLGCEIGELLIPEPDKVTRPANPKATHATLAGARAARPVAGGAASARRPLHAAGLTGGRA